MNQRFHLAVRWCTLSAFLHLVMMSCSEDAAAPIDAIPGSFESMVVASVQDQVVYIPEGETLSIEVLSIEDSRCPSDGVCIWAGVAQVKFSITGIGQAIVLYTPRGSDSQFPSSSTFLFSGRLYELTLVDVTPYPTTKNRESRQEAHFRVRHLD